VKGWYREHRQWLHPGPDLKLEIDKDAKRLNTPIDKPEMFEKAIAGLREHRQDAKALLARYAPTETKDLKSVDAWGTRFKESKPYLFFSDQGDYRWYIDPLAKKRRIETSRLRGSARASLSP
jgi:hypothetical protein